MSTAEPVPPLVGAALWSQVMAAAGYRCQCAGACGRKHTNGSGRCTREHSVAADHRLHAAAADVTASQTKAAALPAGQLRAWCPACLDGATAATRRAVKDTPADGALDLFDVTGLRRPRRRRR